jgi:tRNA (guanine37-N1)-methyltransferase
VNIHILTLFPELFPPFINSGLMERAQKSGLLVFNIVNIRDFAKDKHHTVDDEPYGGGGGMVMMPDPVISAFESLPLSCQGNRPFLMSPRGERLCQSMLFDFAKEEDLVFICGRYKDIDGRVSEILNARELSIGDYVLQGGDIPAMAVIEGVTRLLPDFLGGFDSAEGDSFFEGRGLSAPSFTRPREYRGYKVPDILLSGNHAMIEKWRKSEGERLSQKLKEKE